MTKLYNSYGTYMQIEGLDAIYTAVFGNKKGYFVDVGAYDGYHFSNTWALACAGWSGLCIEPIQQFAAACSKNHAGHLNVNVLNVACGDENTTGTIHEAGTVSTLDEMQFGLEYWRPDYEYSRPQETGIRTLDSILEEFKVEYIDVLSIDVEGFETKVLKGFDLYVYRPKLVIIEVHEGEEGLDWQAEWINDYFRQTLFGSYYRKIYSDAINNIYLLCD